EKWRATLAVEFKGIDEAVRVELSPAEASGRPLTQQSGQRLVRLILALPLGVLGMNPKIAGLVEASSNVASVRCTDDEAAIVT
ncbi:MAG: hypothetical protein GTO30_20760, partial [Acidobacteria bacterium]|nr:hypothetical protein [Acidobacteriota bacterium]NIQ83856.1 hypothetical protein [Acidobacteriota bacterium]